MQSLNKAGVNLVQFENGLPVILIAMAGAWLQGVEKARYSRCSPGVGFT
jgi:hypothetical protein